MYRKRKRKKTRKCDKRGAIRTSFWLLRRAHPNNSYNLRKYFTNWLNYQIKNVMIIPNREKAMLLP
jgi:hypothetical protein